MGYMLDMIFSRAFCMDLPAEESLSAARKAVGGGRAEMGRSSWLRSRMFL